MKHLGTMNVDVITLFVEDLLKTKAFYQDVFKLSTVYEDEVSAVFSFGNMSINLLAISEADGLIQPGKVASPQDGSRFQFTIRVEDIDAEINELMKSGVVLLNGPLNRPWGVRTAAFADPAGHVWELAQQLV
ncbi:VOC family protein [Paenibacillus tianjinensis]|uniref:VOC family protein n=1 Tax=Paenibacillus tianjinensis TaxID=2810347 RepID=A0ABX7L8V1_9BACL|nr:VOC family protein [Paenibacillus tianjinensis]QSF43123.1 VOC family protein [Paenibacillus tianjinensis]